MEGPKKLRHLAAALLLILVLVNSSSPAAAGRPTVGLRAVDLSATLPAPGVALPRDDVKLELDRAHETACDMGKGAGDPKARSLPENYGPLLLSVLPRVLVPPSAPSRKGHEIQT